MCQVDQEAHGSPMTFTVSTGLYVKCVYMYICIHTYMKRRNEEIKKHKKNQKITTGMEYRKTQFYKKEIS